MSLGSNHLSDGDRFPTVLVGNVQPTPPEARWLVESLWSASAVGIIGGQPKCYKTWLATELAVAVASGTPALGQFVVRADGPVLFFAAEDGLPAMRLRCEAVAAARSVALAKLPIHLLDIAELRLDDAKHVDKLHRTVDAIRPRMLVLDPFIRCARLDENSAQEVSAVLGTLRTIQRQHDTAVVVIHHMRKSPSSHPGQQLRGSGDFLAWIDSGLYITRRGEQRILFAEHRGASCVGPLHVRLADRPQLHLELDEPSPTPATPDAGEENGSLASAIVQYLRTCQMLQPTACLRDALKVRKSSLLAALRDLHARGVVERRDDGWRLTNPRHGLTAP